MVVKALLSGIPYFDHRAGLAFACLAQMEEAAPPKGVLVRVRFLRQAQHDPTRIEAAWS